MLMKMGSKQWMDMLVREGTALNIHLSGEQVERMARHADMLMVWNQKVNLTAITDPVEVAVRHFLDSVAPAVHIPSDGHLLDIGTGGGFPGIPLKILRPLQPMTLIDGTRKKITFVKQVIRHLALDAIEAHHARAEDLVASSQHLRRYATIISRAVGDLSQVALLAEPLLADKGKIVVYKGPGEPIPKTVILPPKSDVRAAEICFRVTSVDYKLPVLGDLRKAVILEVDKP